MEGGEAAEEEAAPPLKRSSSVLNAAKLLKKTITKHNLVGAEAQAPQGAPQPAQNGHADHTATNGHAHTGTEQDEGTAQPDHQGDALNQKHVRKKDSCFLATVTEETNGDAETEGLIHNRYSNGVFPRRRSGTTRHRSTSFFACFGDSTGSAHEEQTLL